MTTGAAGPSQMDATPQSKFKVGDKVKVDPFVISLFSGISPELVFTIASVGTTPGTWNLSAPSLSIPNCPEHLMKKV